MREIKFRAWHKEMGSKIDWELICSHHDLCELIKSRHPVEQFTGLKDKSGIDIYDGDIFNLKGKIVSIEYHCGSYLALTGYGWDTENCFEVNEDFAFANNVIGNIHENPELLISEKGD